MSSIRDVAAEAGVSISTVSKVLKNYPYISEETKAKVHEAIDKLHYVPNAVAAALSSKKSGRIALLLNLFNAEAAIDEIDMQYIAGAIEKANELKLDCITVFFSMIKDMSLQEMKDYFRSQSIEGIVIFGLNKECATVHALVESGDFKTVCVDAPLVSETSSCVWVDQVGAQYDVAKKTITTNLGPQQKVLYIHGKENNYVTGERRKGIYKLQKELHFDLKEECADFSELKAREIAFRYARDVDIVVCASDAMAIGAMKAFIEEDVFHPVCGFDGIALMAYAGKQMYTVSQNFTKLSGEAVCEIERLLKGEKGREVVLPYEVTQLYYLDLIK